MATPTKTEISTYEQALPLYNYNPSTPFELTLTSEEERDGVVIQDLTYMAADPNYLPQTDGKIAAYLVKPTGAGSHAGVLYLHGLGQDWGNRKEFLDEAVRLAHQGVISILPTGLFPWIVEHTGDAEIDQINVIKQVIEARRSLDLLLAQPGVDPQRVAVVGHDYGAMTAALLSGVEKRAKAYALMAGDSNYSDWSIKYFIKPADEKVYRKLMSAVDPISYLPYTAPAPLFFQFAGDDFYIPRASADLSFSVASQPKTFGWYESAEHTLNDDAKQDRLAWLKIQLSL